MTYGSNTHRQLFRATMLRLAQFPQWPNLTLPRKHVSSPVRARQTRPLTRASSFNSYLMSSRTKAGVEYKCSSHKMPCTQGFHLPHKLTASSVTFSCTLFHHKWEQSRRCKRKHAASDDTFIARANMRDLALPSSALPPLNVNEIQGGVCLEYFQL